MNRKIICTLLLCALLANITSCELGKPTTSNTDDETSGDTEPESVTAYDISDPGLETTAPDDETAGETAETTTQASETTAAPAETTAAPETQTVDKVSAANYSGTINSATLCGINVVIEWNVDIKENAQNATVSATAYFQYLNLHVNDTRTGALKIGDASADYSTGSIQESNKIRHEITLAELTAEVPLSQGQVELSAEWNLGGNYGGVYIGNIVADGTVMLTDEYQSLPKTASIDVKSVLQTPELPNGCEITSLAATLNYLGFGVDKLTLNDKYLKIGDAYTTDPSEACAVNPRETNSFGCLSPVIVDAAAAYIKDANDPAVSGKAYAVKDITCVNVDDLYLKVAS